MDRADDAKKRLAALQLPVPRPTKAAVAQNRAEQESRHESSTLTKLMSVIKKGPDTARAAKAGEPTLVDPTPVSASEINKETMRAAVGGLGAGEKSLTVEVGTGAPGPNEAAPRSDAPPVNPPTPAVGSTPAQPAPAATEFRPPAADPNELKPVEDSGAPLPPPTQVNEIQKGAPDSSAAATSPDPNSVPATDQDISSSKKPNKKKGLKKIVPF